MTKYTNYSAYVGQPNTPETDAKAKIVHTVDYMRDGKPVSRNVVATDPMDAIARVIAINMQIEAEDIAAEKAIRHVLHIPYIAKPTHKGDDE